MRNLWNRVLTSLAPLLVVAWSSARPAGLRAGSSAPAPESIDASAHAPSVALQQLVCRGGPGFKLEAYKDPSPDNPRVVRAVLRYRRQTTAAGSRYERLESGSCTWNNNGDPMLAVEPGYVYFDIPREAQPWSSTETRQMDTTIDAAAFFPDFISLPRYLADPDKYWLFYPDDKTQLAISFGPYNRPFSLPKYVTVKGSLVRGGPTPSDVASVSPTRELRCRGGSEGLSFTRGASAGANLVKMTLSYRVASVEFGATGKGVGPGICAWVERGVGTPEPGRIEFTTAANAQVNQIRNGSAVDRSPTAAERFPDANTIPAYMRDANHFWTFTVARTEPTVARTNAAWKVSVMDIVTGRRRSESPTARIKPDAPEARPIDAVGARGTTSDAVKAALGIRDVSVTPGLQAVAIHFSTASDAKPVVSLSTAAPVGSPPTARFTAPVQLVVKGALSGNVWQYTAFTQTALAMNTRYWFIISTPAAAGMPPAQRTGEFNTKNQSVIVRFTRVHILNDSDKNSDGELSFRFFIAPATDREPCLDRVSTDGNPGDFTGCYQGFDGRQWGSGSTHPLANTLEMATAPNRIRVWVKGWDVDDIRGDEREAGSFFGPGAAGNRYGVGGGSDIYADWNTASGEFNIGISPERSPLKIPFKLRSVDGSVFMFEVEGEIEVIRQ
jgi:hypothetical protein